MTSTLELDQHAKLNALRRDGDRLNMNVSRLLEIDRRCVEFERRLLRGERAELAEFTRGLNREECCFLMGELRLAEEELNPPPNPDGELLIKIGCTLGRYRLLRLIGRGGMGQVFAARDLLLQREVAIKVLRAELLGADHIRRFDREARTVAALNHPNILSLYDYGTHQGQPFVVTELLQGKSLADRLGKGTFLIREALLVLKQVVAGLQAAHAMGIVHRDLKPGNIAWMQAGMIKVLDFGLVGYHDRQENSSDASLVEGASPNEVSDAKPMPVDENLTITKPGTVVGTVGYVAPEQLRGERVGPTADVFSCGCILYEMLVGDAPFRRPSMAATIAATLNEPYDKDKLAAVGCCKPMIQFVDGCLQKEPKDRFQSAATLNLAIDALWTAREKKSPFRSPRLMQTSTRHCNQKKLPSRRSDASSAAGA